MENLPNNKYSNNSPNGEMEVKSALNINHKSDFHFLSFSSWSTKIRLIIEKEM